MVLIAFLTILVLFHAKKKDWEHSQYSRNETIFKSAKK